MFLFKRKCRHENFSAIVKCGYCPDCGDLLITRWFITRCPICGKRQVTVIKNGEPVPADKFCKNCGCSEYTIEEIEYPDVVTINYACYKTEEIKQNPIQTINAWIENAGNINLLPLIPA